MLAYVDFLLKFSASWNSIPESSPFLFNEEVRVSGASTYESSMLAGLKHVLKAQNPPPSVSRTSKYTKVPTPIQVAPHGNP